jgi:teichuronic acid biosynthesis glycosyltransferase TuaH
MSWLHQTVGLRDGVAADRPILVYFPGVSWDAIPGTDRRLVEHLAGCATVLWVEPPHSMLHLVRSNGWRGLRRVLDQPTPGVLRLLVPGPPGVTRPLVRDVARRRTERGVRRVLRAVDARVDGVIMSSPDGRLGSIPADRRFYYATDDFVAGAVLMGGSRAAAQRAEALNAAAADVVLTVSEDLATKFAGSARRIVVLPNGCEPAHYADVDSRVAPHDVGDARPVAGVVGQLNERLSLELLEAVADRGVHLLLVGPRTERDAQFGRRLDALVGRPNVTWVGAKSFHELPDYVSVIDVGLTPYADTAFNRASFPLKTLEYLCAGRAVVASDLPATRWLDTPLVEVTQSPENFAEAVVNLLDAGGKPMLRAERRAFAQRHSWAARAEELIRLL